MANITITNTRQRSITRDLKAEKVYSWDADNAYPQRVRDLVFSSGVAKQALEKFATFVMGQGIADSTLYKRVVNRYGMTFDKLMRFAIKDYCLNYSFAIHVSYNAAGDPIAYTPMPVEYIRLCWDGRIAYYDNWDRRKLKDNGKYNANDIVRFNRFNPARAASEISVMPGDTIAEKIAAYPGQVYWYSAAGDNEYPLSPFDPVLEDIEVDAEVKIGKLKNVKSNFMAAQMVIYRGKFESDQAKAAFVESLTEFQGNENLGTMMLVEVADGAADFDIKPFNIMDFDKYWEHTERSVQENIVRALQQPQVLSTMAVAGKLGTSSEIEDAKVFYSEITGYHRMIIEEEFSRLIGQSIQIVPVATKSNQRNAANNP